MTIAVYHGHKTTQKMLVVGPPYQARVVCTSSSIRIGSSSLTRAPEEGAS